MVRVLVAAENARFNVDDAARFGDVTYVLPRTRRSISPFKTQELVAQMLEELRDVGYDPDVDYVAFTGGMIHVSLLYGAVMKEWGRAKILIFDAPNDRYVERTV